MHSSAVVYGAFIDLSICYTRGPRGDRARIKVSLEDESIRTVNLQHPTFLNKNMEKKS